MPLKIMFVFKQPAPTGTLALELTFKNERDYRKQLATVQRQPFGTFKTISGELVTLEMANIHHMKSGTA